jgi:hypothetical protein
LRDLRLAERVYDYSLEVFTKDSTTSVALQKQAIEESKRTTRISKEVAPGEIFDFRFAQRANRELVSSGWRP